MKKKFSNIMEHSVLFPFFISFIIVGLFSIILIKKKESLGNLTFKQTIHLIDDSAIIISNSHYPYLREAGKYWLSNQSMTTATFENLKIYLQSKPTMDCGPITFKNGKACFSVKLSDNDRASLLSNLNKWEGISTITFK